MHAQNFRTDFWSHAFRRAMPAISIGLPNVARNIQVLAYYYYIALIMLIIIYCIIVFNGETHIIV